MYNEWNRIVMRTIVQDALSSVISDIQSASIAQWIEPGGRGFEPWRGGHVPATLRSSYRLVDNGYARHELKKKTEINDQYYYCDQILLIGTKYS